jgi:hypothetical protein
MGKEATSAARRNSPFAVAQSGTGAPHSGLSLVENILNGLTKPARREPILGHIEP